MSVFLQRMGLAYPIADGDFGAVSEEITIPGAHNSREFDLMTIDGVDIADFSFIQITGDAISSTGSGSNIKLGVRLSTNGGAAWLGGSTYRNIRYDHLSSSTYNIGYMILHEGTADWWFTAYLENFNSAMPTSMISQQLHTSDASPDRNGGITKGSAAVHNGLQLWIESSTGTVKFDGGVISITGYR